MKKTFAAIGAAFAVATLFADISVTSPKKGETVPQRWPEMIPFLEMPREQRKTFRDKGGRKAVKALKTRRASAKPVEISWTGATGPCTVKVELPGCLFLSADRYWR